MEAFLTGSRVYGKPREDSDVDLVIFADHETARALWERFVADEDAEPPYRFPLPPERSKGFPLRAGDLNLIVCTDYARYESWRVTTATLRRRAAEAGRPVPREDAVAAFKAAFASETRMPF